MNDQQRKTRDFFLRKGFLPADKTSYPVYKKYEQYSMFQEMSATIITTWAVVYNGLYKVINGCLCSVFFYEGKEVYFTVHRPPEPEEASLREIIDTLWDLARKVELPFLQIKFIEDRYLPEFQAIEGYEVKTGYNRDDCDYVYRNQDIIELEGKINYNKRKRLNKCFKDNRISFKNITNQNIGVCLDIEEYWCHEKDCRYCESFSGCEKIAIETMAEIFDEKIYTGFILYIDDVPSGYAIGEVINEKIAFGYFGKALNQDHFVYCMYMLSKDGYNAAECVNCNEDMGNMGIRMFKSHLGLYTLWNKYICTFEKK
jgi:hypothetical protein